VNALATNIVLWTSAITGLVSVLWQLKKTVSRITEFFEFAKGLEPKITQISNSMTETNEMLSEHIRDHPGGT
jgi:hypothetical protein